MVKKRHNFLVTVLFVISIYFVFNMITPVISDLAGIDNVARVRLHDVISIEPSLFGGVSSDSVLQILNQAEQDSSIKAVLLDIDSPGGGPVASFEIYEKVKDFKKPIIVVIREIGASGAYWVASGADWVIANELSLVGSVGVTASFLSFEDLMEEFGVSYNRFVSGEQKDLFSQYRNRTDEEVQILQGTIQEIFNVFLGSVEKDRNLTQENKDVISNGGVFLGKKSLELGLIDEVGGFKEAEDWLITELGSNKIKFVDFSMSSFSVFDLIKNKLVFDSFKVNLI